MELNIGSIKLPMNAATKSFALLGKRGSGKTYNAAVIAEEFARVGIPFVVFDPIDVWWGLRLSADGKKRGLPVVVFGLQHADIIIDREDGARIAQAVVRDNISCVISTFGMPKVAQRQIIKDFSEELMRINNTPRHIFIEEAHEFVPQRVFGAMGTVFAAVEALVVMGRNVGIGVTLINQRAATINKDVLTQVDTLLAFRNVAPQDRKALQEWVEAHGADGDFKKFMDSLPSLPTGEGWIWSPEWMGIFKRIKIRKRTTLHPDREKLGDKFEMPELEPTDVEAFISKFNASKPAPQSNETKESKKKGKVSTAASRSRTANSTVHVSVSPDQREKDIELAVKQAETRMRNEFESTIIGKDTEIGVLKKKLGAIGALAQQLVNLTAVSADMGEVAVAPTYSGAEGNLILAKLGGMPRNIYEALLKHPAGLTKRQIAIMCGYSISGSFRNAIGKLKAMGMVKKEGEIFIALTR